MGRIYSAASEFDRGMDPTDNPPAPNQRDRARWEHTRLRRRMLEGLWRRDLQRQVLEAVGKTRSTAWRLVDDSSNPFATVCSELAVLYNLDIQVTHPRVRDARLVKKYLDEALFLSLMQRVSKLTIGLREMLLRVDMIPPDPEVGTPAKLVLRPVPPDVVTGVGDEDCPDQAVELAEARLRKKPGERDEYVWTWDVANVADPDNPTFRVLNAERDQDLSGVYLDEPASGDDYLFVDSQGAPELPYVLYHAARSTQLWDAYEGRELVSATLMSGTLYSFTSHAFLHASWPQRWAYDVEVDGDGEADPAALAVFKRSAESDASHPIQIGQFSPGASIGEMMEGCAMYERRAATFAGVSPSDFVRSSGDPRSGYALAISNEGKRNASRRYMPVFAAADEKLCRLVAILHNRLHPDGPQLAEDGYRVTYQAIPLSKEERAAKREDVLARLAAGLITKVQAIVELDDVTEDEARRRLAEIDVQAPEPSSAPNVDDAGDGNDNGDTDGSR